MIGRLAGQTMRHDSASTAMIIIVDVETILANIALIFIVTLGALRNEIVTYLTMTNSWIVIVYTFLTSVFVRTELAMSQGVTSEAFSILGVVLIRDTP